MNDSRVRLVETVGGFSVGTHEGRLGPLASGERLIHHLVKTVLALGVHGECVIVGRGAVFHPARRNDRAGSPRGPGARAHRGAEQKTQHP